MNLLSSNIREWALKVSVIYRMKNSESFPNRLQVCQRKTVLNYYVLFSGSMHGDICSSPVVIRKPELESSLL